MSLCDKNRVSIPTDLVDVTNGESEKSLIDLKNGKVIFKQKPISFEKHSETLQEIVKFREMLDDRISRREESLTAIPEEHAPVIAKLVHESDKTLSALSKHILHELLPVQDEDGDHQNLPPPLTLSVVESGIKSVANRNNYGLDGMPGVKAPAAVCVWRWEAKPTHMGWLPKNARERAENRMAERVQAKVVLKAMFDSLPRHEQGSILDPKGSGGKAPVMDTSSTSVSSPIDLVGADLKSPQAQASKRTKEDEENDATPVPKVGRPKKIPDPEKTVKEKEKQERKAAKAEREQKEREAQNKSRSLMKNFFKAANSSRVVPATESTSDGTARSSVSQFHKTFKPFLVKKDSAIAPVNWFKNGDSRRQPLKYDSNIIVIDDEDDSRRRMDMENTDVKGMSAKDRLRSTLQNLPPSLHIRGTRLRTYNKTSGTHLKTSNPVSVRDLVAQLNEAEMAGDVNLVRSITSKLSDGDRVPAKVLVFVHNARPGYFGTWTRDSSMIGPRTPFIRDVAIFDYDYDSGEEWEEEPAGDADDVIDDADDEDGGLDEEDSDIDSWLVDDDDEPEVHSERDGSPILSTLQGSTKRKSEAEDAKLTKKRKVVIPLVPFAKGPSWEQIVGRCEHNMFNPYRIQLLNDAPFPIDPFTFVSQSGDIITGKRDGFAVPSLPYRLAVSHPDSLIPQSTAVSKRTVAAPKTAFPEIHTASLLDIITSSQTSSLPILVDTIYQDLRDHKVKKNSIEAKVREVAEKCKVKKVWIVKETFRIPIQTALR